MEAMTVRATWRPLALLLALLLGLAAATAASASTLSGRMLMKDGTPLAGGMAVAFDLRRGPPPAPDRYLRAPDYMAGIDDDGGFEIILPQGQYSLAAVRRKDGTGGPPAEGDLFFVVKNRKNEPRVITVPATGEVHLGDLAGAETFAPVSDPLLPLTAVAGTIRDREGQPRAGLTVFAVQAGRDKGEAMFISPPTGSDGRYSVRLPAGGTYRLGLWAEGPPVDARKETGTTIRVATGEQRNGVDLELP